MANWKYTLDIKDIFNNEDISHNQRLGKIAEKIEELQKSSAIMGTNGVLSDIKSLFISESEKEEFTDMSGDDFDAHMSHLYNFADIYRIWIKTF